MAIVAVRKPHLTKSGVYEIYYLTNPDKTAKAYWGRIAMHDEKKAWQIYDELYHGSRENAPVKKRRQRKRKE